MILRLGDEEFSYPYAEKNYPYKSSREIGRWKECIVLHLVLLGHHKFMKLKRKTGWNSNTLTKTLKRLVKKGMLEKGEKGKGYYLTDEGFYRLILDCGDICGYTCYTKRLNALFSELEKNRKKGEIDKVHEIQEDIKGLLEVLHMLAYKDEILKLIQSSLERMPNMFQYFRRRRII